MPELWDLILDYEDTLIGQLVALAAIAVLWSHVKGSLLIPILKQYHQSQPYWKQCQARQGYFGPISKELMWNSLSCLQHFTAGSLMLAGWVLGSQQDVYNPNRLVFFRAGVVAEVSFEILDILDMVRGTGVWKTGDKDGNIHPGVYFSTIAHHLPGIALVFPLNLWCSCVELWQRCAMALELGGGFSLLLACYRESLGPDISTLQKRLALFTVNFASLLFMVWVRFFVVTPAMLTLIKAGFEINCKTTYALVVGAVLMTIFNVMWVMSELIQISSGMRPADSSGGKKKVE